MSDHEGNSECTKEEEEEEEEPRRRLSHELPDLGDQIEASKSFKRRGSNASSIASHDDSKSTGSKKRKKFWHLGTKSSKKELKSSQKPGLFTKIFRRKKKSLTDDTGFDENEIFRSKSQPITKRGGRFVTEQNSFGRSTAEAPDGSRSQRDILGSQTASTSETRARSHTTNKDYVPMNSSNLPETIQETSEKPIEEKFHDFEAYSCDSPRQAVSERSGVSSEDYDEQSQNLLQYNALPFSPSFGGHLSGWMLHMKRHNLFGVTAKWFILSSSENCLYKANSPLDNPVPFARLDGATVTMTTIGSRQCISIDSPYFNDETPRRLKRFITSDSRIQLTTWYNALERVSSQSLKNFGSGPPTPKGISPSAERVSSLRRQKLEDAQPTAAPDEYDVLKKGLSSFLSRVLFSLLYAGKDAMETHPYMQQIQRSRRVVQLRDARWYHEKYQEMVHTFLKYEQEAKNQVEDTGISEDRARLISLAQNYARRMPSNLIQQTLAESSSTTDETEAVKRLEGLFGDTYPDLYTTGSYDVIGRVAALVGAVDLDVLLKSSYHMSNIGDQDVNKRVAPLRRNVIGRKRDIQTGTALNQPAVKEAAQYGPLEHQRPVRENSTTTGEDSESQQSDLDDSSEGVESSFDESSDEDEKILRESDEEDSDSSADTREDLPNGYGDSKHGTWRSPKNNSQTRGSNTDNRVTSLPPTFKCMHNVEIYASPNIMMLIGYVHHSAHRPPGMTEHFESGHRKPGFRSKFRVIALDRRNDNPPSLEEIVLWCDESVLFIPEEKELLIDLLKQGKDADVLQVLRKIASFYLSKDTTAYTRALAPFYDSVYEGRKQKSLIWDQQDWIELSTRGLAGSVSFLRGYYLLFILKRKRVGLIGSHQIFAISEYLLLPVMYSNLGTSVSIWKKLQRKLSTILGHTDFRVAEDRYRSLFCQVDLGKDFYLSYTWDLTRHLQQQIQVGISEHGGKQQTRGRNVEVVHNDWGNLKGYSQSVKKTAASPGPLWNVDADWGYYLSHELRKVLRDNSQAPHNDNSFPSSWLVPLVHGTFHQANLTMLGRQLTLTLIARRSRHFAGTRYLKRGVTSEGFVANDVEVEQILADTHGRYTSYVQMRGSVPVFWTQVADFKVPRPPVLMKPVDPHYMASKRHFYNLFQRYGGPILCLNLVKKKPRYPKEVDLSQEFALAVMSANEELSHCPVHRIQMLSLDFSELAKSPTHNVLQSMRDAALWGCNNTGFFASHPSPALLRKYGRRSPSATQPEACSCFTEVDDFPYSSSNLQPTLVQDMFESGQTPVPLHLLTQLILQRCIHFIKEPHDQHSIKEVISNALQIFVKESSSSNECSITSFTRKFYRQKLYMERCLSPWSTKIEDNSGHKARLESIESLRQKCLKAVEEILLLSIPLRCRVEVTKRLNLTVTCSGKGNVAFPQIAAPVDDVKSSFQCIRSLISYACLLKDPGASTYCDSKSALGKRFRYEEHVFDQFPQSSYSLFNFEESFKGGSKFLKKSLLRPSYTSRKGRAERRKTTARFHPNEEESSRRSALRMSHKKSSSHSFIRTGVDKKNSPKSADQQIGTFGQLSHPTRSLHPYHVVHEDHGIFNAEDDVFMHSHHHSHWTKANMKSFRHFSGRRGRSGIFPCPVQAAKADEYAFRTLAVAPYHTAVVPPKIDDHSLIYRNKDNVEQHKKDGCHASIHPEVGLAWRLLEAEAVGRSDESVLRRLRREVPGYRGVNPDESTAKSLRAAESELLDQSSVKRDPQNYLHANISGRTCCPGHDGGDTRPDNQPEAPEILLQQGAMRSNCVDCLDRTNVAQCCVGLHVLVLQLQALGLVPVTAEEDWSSEDGQTHSSSTKSDDYVCSEHKGFPTSTNSFGAFYPGACTLHPKSALARICMEMYEDMGDRLALQYGGSEAHKKITSQSSKHDRAIFGKVGRLKGIDEDVNESPFGPGAGSTTFYLDNVAEGPNDDEHYPITARPGEAGLVQISPEKSDHRDVNLKTLSSHLPSEKFGVVNFRDSNITNGSSSSSNGDERDQTSKSLQQYSAFFEVGDSPLDAQPALHVSFKEGVSWGKRNTTSSSNKAMEMLTSIRRYVSNTIRDALKQDAMNVFLGAYQPKHTSVHLWSMDSDFLLHNGRKWWPIVSVSKKNYDASTAVNTFIHRSVLGEQWWLPALSNFAVDTDRSWISISQRKRKEFEKYFLSENHKREIGNFRIGLSFARGGLAHSDSIHFKRSLNFFDESLSKQFFLPRSVMDWKRFGSIDYMWLSKLWKHLGIEATMEQLRSTEEPRRHSSVSEKRFGHGDGHFGHVDRGETTRIDEEDGEHTDEARETGTGARFIKNYSIQYQGSEDLSDEALTISDKTRIPPWLRNRKDVYVDENGEIQFIGMETSWNGLLPSSIKNDNNYEFSAYIIYPRNTYVRNYGSDVDETSVLEGIKVPIASRFHQTGISDIGSSEMWRHVGLSIVVDHFGTGTFEDESLLRSTRNGTCPGLEAIQLENLRRLALFSEVFGSELHRKYYAPKSLLLRADGPELCLKGYEEDLSTKAHSVSERYDQLYTLMLPTEQLDLLEIDISRQYSQYIRAGMYSREFHNVELRCSVGKIVRCLCGSKAAKELLGASLADGVNFDNTKDPFRRCSRSTGGKRFESSHDRRFVSVKDCDFTSMDQLLKRKASLQTGYLYGSFRVDPDSVFAQVGISWDLAQVFSGTLYSRAAVEGAIECIESIVSYFRRLDSSGEIPSATKHKSESAAVDPATLDSEWHVRLDNALCASGGKITLELMMQNVSKEIAAENYLLEDRDPVNTHSRKQLLRIARKHHQLLLHDPVQHCRNVSAASGWIRKFHYVWKELTIRDVFATQSMLLLVQRVQSIDAILFRRDPSIHIPKHLIPVVLVKLASNTKERRKAEESKRPHASEAQYDVEYKDSTTSGLKNSWYNATLECGTGVEWELTAEESKSFTHYAKKLSKIEGRCSSELTVEESYDQGSLLPGNSWMTEADREIYREYVAIGEHQGVKMPGNWYKGRQVDIEPLLTSGDQQKEQCFVSALDVGLFNVSCDDLDANSIQQKKWGANYDLLRYWRQRVSVHASASSSQEVAKEHLSEYKSYLANGLR